jgi:hypothetical protein
VPPASIRLSGILYQGKAYAGVLKWVPGTANATLAGPLELVRAPETVESLQARLAVEKRNSETLSRQLAEEKRASESLRAQVAELQRRAVTMPVAAAPASERPFRTVHSGFAGGTALLGNWRATTTGASQQSAAARFAKYALPVPQAGVETLFEYTARTRAGGWVGHGLHLFASGKSNGKGYGFGNSYLVWLTRDERFYKTNHTYVQLYRSFDDVRMVQLASVGIPEAISGDLRTAVHYNPAAKAIIVAVNGVERLRYQVGDAIPSGDWAALRSLGGPVDFSSLSVKVR